MNTINIIPRSNKYLQLGDLFHIKLDSGLESIFIYSACAYNTRQFISIEDGMYFTDEDAPLTADKLPAYFRRHNVSSWTHIGPVTITYEAR